MRRFIGIVFVLVGCIFFLYPTYQEYKIQRNVDEIEQEIRIKQRNPTTQNQQEDANTFSSKSSVLYNELVSYNQNLLGNQNITDAWSEELSKTEIPNLENGIIGYIEIPDMGTRLPLYVGSSYNHLARGASVLAGTSMPIGGENTNCVIAGHRGWRGNAYFQYIENMKEGSKVYITTQWETLTYRAVDTKIIYPTELDYIKIQPGKDMITLVSCYPFTIGGGANQRFLVFCERTENDRVANTEAINSIEDIVKFRIKKPTNPLEWEMLIRTLVPGIVIILIGVILMVKGIRKTLKHKF